MPPIVRKLFDNLLSDNKGEQRMAVKGIYQLTEGELGQLLSMLNHQSAYRDNADMVKEYESFLSVSGQKMLSGQASKGMAAQVFYRELCVDRHKAREFHDRFVSWMPAGSAS